MREKSGWGREIIDPFNALIAPRTLVWKEKYGTLRAEWLWGPAGACECVGPMAMVLEEASTLCCMDCGRWNGWQYSADDELVTVVTTQSVRGWTLTLCDQCRAKEESDLVGPGNSAEQKAAAAVPAEGLESIPRPQPKDFA